MASEVTTEQRVVHAHVFDPRNSLFKQAKSSKAECHTVLCVLDECELRNRGECATRNIFGHCPYGKSRCEVGPTRRAGGFGKWVHDRKERFKEVDYLNPAKQKLAFIGDYVYLPYAHMNMLKDDDIPGLGSLFVPRDMWTVEAVLKLIDFRPRALFTYQEIASYQSEVVPKFIAHIRESDPVMWSLLIEKRPSLDIAPNYVGRVAIIKTLKHPIKIRPYKPEYPVAWEWDGTKLRTTSVHAYGSTWGHLKAQSAVVEIVPADDATVVVESNEWVTSETRFVD